MALTFEQGLVFAVLLLALVLFVWGKWRYDIVALLALMTLVLSGILPPEGAFQGLGHPAVVTVMAVLVCSRGLQNSGAIDWITRWFTGIGNNMVVQLAALCGLVAFLSAFMNNIGALAILMPVAISMARKSKRSAALYLMPLAFSAHFGGMMTLIGTPPNLIISSFRASAVGEPFRMFDLTSVGLPITIVGVLFTALIGWRLIPKRQGQGLIQELYQIEGYLSEVTVPANSILVGKSLVELRTVTQADVTVIGLVRNGYHVASPSSYEMVRADDKLIVKADASNLKDLISDAGLNLAEAKPVSEKTLEGVSVVEAVVVPSSNARRKTARSLNLRAAYGLNLLAISRHGAHIESQLRDVSFRVGDVLLLQGRSETLPEALQSLGFLPLAQRKLTLAQPRRMVQAVLTFGISVVLAAAGVLPVHIAFVLAGIVMVLTGLLTLREAYDSVDLPIVILLAAMIPVGIALETTGGAALIAFQVVNLSGVLSPAIIMVVMMIFTMFLSDLINNAAAAVLMAPIVIRISQELGVSPDPFLIALTISASCAFLTPIGHQSNTLVLAPGEYRFGDFWRLGLPLEILIILVATPLILFFWPM
jgi:di/tricarboxylate transporter